MEKFSVNYEQLHDTLTSKKRYRLEDVKDKITKVAFDVVKFSDGDNVIDGLWEIKSCDDGEYIVALYDNDDKKVSTASVPWSVIADSSGTNINIFYKEKAIKKVSLASLGIPKEDHQLVCKSLPSKLASNKSLANSLLNDLPELDRNELFQKYPELK